ncbi:MAG: GNAT family N-acetyltransferase [Fimbriimonas sp.]|nr:GNAT family N-acetyltransferase [Fimbriimonas sp.]
MPERIVTDRLILRKQERGDAPQVRIAVEESHEELRRWLVWAREVPSTDAIEAYIARNRAAWELREQYMFHLFDYAGRFVGVCGLERIDWDLRGFEIGYWLRTSSAGKGYMSESVRALGDHAFTAFKARRVMICCDAKNDRSAAIPRRLGYCLEGILKNERLDANGVPQDTMVWAKTES